VAGVIGVATGAASECDAQKYPAGSLTITEPADGATVDTDEVVIRGIAPPGAEVRRDIRGFKKDDKFDADANGQWEYRTKLDTGENEFNFFLQDAKDAKAKLTIKYAPPVVAEPTATASPKTTAAPATGTEAPTTTTGPSPEPTAAPPVPLEQRVERSYQDNLDFMLWAADDDLKVEWLPELTGLVKISVHPELVLSEGDFLTIAGSSAIVASRAIWTTYPEVHQIEVTVLGDFTDQFGNTATELAAQTTVLRATGEQFNYEGLRDRHYGDNKLFFCVADHYEIHLAIYTKLWDKGCLAQWGFKK